MRGPAIFWRERHSSIETRRTMRKSAALETRPAANANPATGPVMGRIEGELTIAGYACAVSGPAPGAAWAGISDWTPLH